MFQSIYIIIVIILKKEKEEDNKKIVEMDHLTWEQRISFLHNKESISP